MTRKIVPFKDPGVSRDKLIKAVGRVIAGRGFVRLGVNEVAREAGVNKGLIYRYFGGLKGLISAFSRTVEFWPDVNELLKDDGERLKRMSPGRLMAVFFRRYLRAVAARPLTLEIMAWEGLERNDLTGELEQTRVRTALEFFEYLKIDPPEDVDLSAVVAVMAAAVTFIAVHSRLHRFYGGIDLRADEGLARIERTMEMMLVRTLDTGLGCEKRTEKACTP